MAFRFDPRGDLPVPIIQNTSYYHRPDSSISRYDRRSAYGPPPSFPKKRPCYDWIFSSASNIHVAVDRSSFKEYSSFKSYVLTVSDQRQVTVKGVGTVELKIRRQPGSKDGHRVLLENVLHIPGWLCNVMSDAVFLPVKDFEHDWTEFGVNFQRFSDGKWKAWGYTENFCGLDKVVMARKLDGRSPMLEDKDREIFSVNVMWPQSQRDQWDKLVADNREARAKAEAAKKERSPLAKVAQMKKSLPDFDHLTRNLRSGLSEVDPNVSRVPNARGSSLKAATSTSAFVEALPSMKSTE